MKPTCLYDDCERDHTSLAVVGDSRYKPRKLVYPLRAPKFCSQRCAALHAAKVTEGQAYCYVCGLWDEGHRHDHSGPRREHDHQGG